MISSRRTSAAGCRRPSRSRRGLPGGERGASTGRRSRRSAAPVTSSSSSGSPLHSVLREARHVSTDRSELDQAVRALKADLLAPGTADLSRILSSTRQAASSAAHSCVRGGLLRPRAFPQTLGFKKTSRCPGAESNHRHGDFQSPALPTELPGRKAGEASGIVGGVKTDGAWRRGYRSLAGAARTRPARAPVWAPSFTVSAPFTSTCRKPSG